MKGQSYLAIGANINPQNYILAEFYLETDEKIMDIAEAIAGESSIGTWTSLSTMTNNIFSSLAPKIYEIKELNTDDDLTTNEAIIKIAYPIALWEMGSIPQLLSAVAGNIFGMRAVKNLRLLDLHFPQAFIDSFAGPAFGIDGVRQLMDIYDRPLIGTIIKPKCGLPTAVHAEVAYQAWLGGVDVVKDDENLTDQAFNPFESRVRETLKLKRKAEEKSGRRKMYVINITASSDEMIERAKFAKSEGAECVMVDILTAGFAGVQHVRSKNLGMVIHGHRAMHAAFTNNPRHGISMMVVAKAARLAGVDQLHTGTVIGKMEGGKDTVTLVNESMREEWGSVKSTLPIASGGLHPGHTRELMRILGKDFIVNYGGGIHGHPDGTYEGAKAAIQSVEASLQNIPLEQYARKAKNKALKTALQKWGEYKSEGDDRDDTYIYDMVK